MIWHHAGTLSCPLPAARPESGICFWWIGHSIQLAYSGEVYLQKKAQIHPHTAVVGSQRCQCTFPTKKHSLRVASVRPPQLLLTSLHPPLSPPSPLPPLTPTTLVVTRHNLWHELGQCAGSSKLTPPPRSPYTSSIHQKQMPLSGLAAVSHARTLPQEDGQRLLEGPWAQLISKVYLKKHPTLPRCYTLNAKDKKMVNDFWKARARSGSA